MGPFILLPELLFKAGNWNVKSKAKEFESLKLDKFNLTPDQNIPKRDYSIEIEDYNVDEFDRQSESNIGVNHIFCC